MYELGVPEDVDYFVYASWEGGPGRYRKVHKVSLDVLISVQPDSTFTRQILPMKGTIYMVGQLRTRKLQVSRHDTLALVQRYQGGGLYGMGCAIIKDSRIFLHGGWSENSIYLSRINEMICDFGKYF